MADVGELHSKQVAFWNGEGAARWMANQARRAASRQPHFADVALDRAGIQPGESVIEIGCGTGETSVQLVQRVGPAGRVLAADVSAPILEAAKANLEPYPNATAVVADAAVYPFEPASADLVFSRFGVMFFGDPTAAFANIRKAVKPGGRLVFVCWRTAKENPWMTGPLAAVFEHISRPPPPGPDEPGAFSFADKDRVTAILTKAGFTAPAFEPVDTLRDVSNGRGLDGAVEAALEFGPVPGLLKDQPETVKTAVAASVRRYLEDLEAGGAVMQAAAIWIVTAKAA